MSIPTGRGKPSTRLRSGVRRMRLPRASGRHAPFPFFGSPALKRVISLFIPEGLLLAAAVAFARWGLLRPGAAGFVGFLGAAALATGVFIGWRFHRARLVFGLLILAAAERALVLLPPAPGTGLAGGALASGIALLLPLNLAALAFLPERGFFTALGRVRLLALLAQAALLAVVVRVTAPGAASLFEQAFLPGLALDWTRLAQPAAIAFLVALVALAGRIIWKPGDAIGRGFFWAVPASFLGLVVGADGGAGTLYFTAAQLILVAAGLESAYAMAFRDELTGLPSRRALSEATARLEEPYVIAMVDVDHFKSFNDQYGHDVGDQVLAMVASKLAQATGGCTAYRYGGEEFTLVFPGKDIGAVWPHLDAVRQAVESAAFTLRDPRRPKKKPRKSPGKIVTRPPARQFTVTVSIGVSEYGARLETPDAVIQAADAALYRAKEGGRNQVSR